MVSGLLVAELIAVIEGRNTEICGFVNFLELRLKIITSVVVAALIGSSSVASARDNAGIHEFMMGQQPFQTFASPQISDDTPIHKRYFNHIVEGVNYVKYRVDTASDYVSATAYEGISYGRKVVSDSGGESGVRAMVTQVALQEGVSPAIALAVAHVESTMRCNIGGGGIMQVNKRTAAGVGVHGDLRSCSNSIRAGTRYLKRMMASNRNLCSALSGYNNGRANSSCTVYGRRVIATLRRFHYS